METRGGVRSFALVGMDGVGKRSLLWQFNTRLQRLPTSDDMPIRNTVEVDGAPYLIELAAISTEENLQAYLQHSLLYEGGILLVYSVDSSDSFLQAKAWAMRLSQLQGPVALELASQRGRPRPMLVLVGNKADLAGQRQVSAEAGRSLAMELGVGFMETTAKFPSGIRMPISEAIVRSNAYVSKSRAEMLERITSSRRGGVFSALGKRISGVFQSFDRGGRRKKQQQQQQEEKSGAGRGSMTPDNSAPPSVLGSRHQTRRVLKKKKRPPPTSARSTPQPRVRRLDVDLGPPLDTAGVYEGQPKHF